MKQFRGTEIPPGLPRRLREVLEKQNRFLRGLHSDNKSTALVVPSMSAVVSGAAKAADAGSALLPFGGNLEQIPIGAPGAELFAQVRPGTEVQPSDRLDLAGTFTPTRPSDILSLLSDGKRWIEQGRSNPHFGVFIPAESFGARPNTGADMTSRIQRAFDECPEGATLVFRSGTYLISNTVWLSRNISVWAIGVVFDLELNTPTTTFTGGLPPTWDGAFLTRAAREADNVNNAAFVWGTLGSDRPERQFVKGLHVSRNAAGNSHTDRLHCGIVMLSPFECDLIDTRTNNFFGGLVLASHTGQGVAYNRVTRHKDSDSRYPFNLIAQNGGFANQNSFYDLRCLITTAIRDSALYTPDAWELLRILWASTTNSTPNNNQFYGCVLEAPTRSAPGPVGDPGASGDPVSIGRKARIEGRDMLFTNCRWEGVRRVNAANPAPLKDVTIGIEATAGLTSANFVRNVFFYGDRLSEILERDHVEYLDSGALGLNNSNQWYTGRVNEFGATGPAAAPTGDTNVKTTAWRFLQGSSINAAMAICSPNFGTPRGLEVMQFWHDPNATVDPLGVLLGTISFQDTTGTTQNTFGFHNLSPFDLRISAGLTVGNVFRMRPSGIDALVTNPQTGGRVRSNVTTGGPWEFYSTGSSNNDLIRLLDANEDTRLVMKVNETGITAGMYSAIVFYEESVAGAETLANAIVLHSTPIGGGTTPFPIGIEKGLMVNRSNSDSDSQFRGDNESNLLYLDASEDRLGMGTAAPTAFLHILGREAAETQLRVAGFTTQTTPIMEVAARVASTQPLIHFRPLGGGTGEIIWASQADVYDPAGFGWRMRQDELSTGDMFLERMPGGAPVEAIRYIRGSEGVRFGGFISAAGHPYEFGSSMGVERGAQFNLGLGTDATYDAFFVMSPGFPGVGLFKVDPSTEAVNLGGSAFYTAARTSISVPSGKAGIITDSNAVSGNIIHWFGTPDGADFGLKIGEEGTATGDWRIIRRSSADYTVMRIKRDTASRVAIYGDAVATGSAPDNASPIETFEVWGSAWFNPENLDKDFRVDGDTLDHLLFADASTDRIGIGTSVPQVRSHVLVRVDPADTVIEALRLQRDALAGAGAAGIGVRLGLWAESATDGSSIAAGQIDAVLDVATLASADSSLRFFAYDGGTQKELVRLVGATPQLVLHDNAFGTPQSIFGMDGSAVFNEQGNSVDFRVESNTLARMLFVDGANDRVGIGFGAGSPADQLHVTGNGRFTQSVRIGGDTGGVATFMSITNALAAPVGATGALLGNTGGAGDPAAQNQSHWLKIYDGTTARYIPVWT